MADLNHIALFIQVVDAGSLSEAARRLGIPKATVSRNISRLESELDTRLLNRTSRRVELTSQGRTYYDSVSQAIGLVSAAGEQLAATRSDPSGTLRVTASIAYGTSGLVELIGRFLDRFPRVSVELRLTDQPLDLVAEGIDLAFRVGPLKSSSFIARNLGPARLVLAASPAYLSRRGQPETVAALSDHDWVVFGRSLRRAVVRLDGPEGRHEIQTRGRLSVDGAYAALLGVQAGLGLGLLPRGLIRGAVERGDLLHLLPQYEHRIGGLFAVYPSQRHQSAASRALLDFVIEQTR